MLDLVGDVKSYLTVGLAVLSALACPTAGAESVTKVPSAVLRPYVPAVAPSVLKPIDIAPAPVAIKEVHFVQPILSKTPVTDALRAEAAKAELAKAEHARAEHARAEHARAEHAKAELARAESAKHEISTLIKADIKPEMKVDSAQFANAESSPVSNELSSIVEGLLGVKYKFGANNPKVALDCSALILRIMEARGKKDLPRTARMLAESSKPVERHNLKAGDLLFFNTRGWDFSHVGMYMGNGRFVHASQQKGKVTFSSLSAEYFAKRFTGARRVIH